MSKTIFFLILLLPCLVTGYLLRGVSLMGWGEWIWQFRISPVLTAIAAGSALSIAGMVMQSYFRNPLAGPYVLGSASGSSLGVALALFVLPWGLGGPFSHLPFALIGGVGATLGVVYLARHARATQVLVAGMLFAQVCSACVSILTRVGDDRELRALSLWSQATFHASDLGSSLIFIAVLFPLVMVLVLKHASLDALFLGEREAVFLGKLGPWDKMILLGVSASLTAVVVSWCGPVAFVGLISPLVVQSLLKVGRHALLLPVNALFGANFGMLVLHAQEWGDSPLLPLDAVAAVLAVPVLGYYLFKGARNA